MGATARERTPSLHTLLDLNWEEVHYRLYLQGNEKNTENLYCILDIAFIRICKNSSNSEEKHSSSDLKDCT